ncbi:MULTISPECIES: two-component system response regulator [unclassified Sulfuricurvum]|uniref:two-component system response regulator n=1 Tax=unclassified Sulfuricurvum TaxID=2632390 RepID=UPI000299675D|nr:MULTISPECIES: EAL domain-containing protein [unclassified Sulfuricurvum]AFV96323.1 response regulator receiver modulated diguanylate cyclase/phosphodiesterase [Candidatus Sulfuricurvum sp. RIFRC-1]HBM36913.1 GGDEF domain-containing protein [Sulfuricurvum sp.]
MSDDELLFAPEEEEALSETPWTVMIVDDDAEVHSFTKLALHDFTYERKPLRFLSAYSAAEAAEIIKKHDDIAIILLDVVMESETAGLDLVETIRYNFNNTMVRIIIRTGQPGVAPERYVIDHYDINDYKEKTELTTDRLYTTVRSALSQYKQIIELLNKKNEIYAALITDSLTGLGNRVKLNYDLDTDEPMSLILLNIDAFSMINDVYGFDVGDQMLLQFGKILHNSSCPACSVYRLEADIFAVLTAHKEIQDVQKEVMRIQNTITKHSFLINAIEHRVNVTMGVVERDMGNMIQKAEIALREARKMSRNRIQVYSDGLAVIQQIKDNTKWTKWLKDALDNDKLIAYYQPIIDCKSGEITKYEALVRLEHDGVIYAPFHFLSTARYAGLLYQITQRVFEQACARFSTNTLHFSVNITDQDLVESDFIRFIEQTRTQYGIDVDRIYFEILEDSSILANPVAEKHLNELTALGYHLCLDDFGVQCSNFAQLGNLDLDIVKIDGTYIKDIDVNTKSQVVTESILFFTHKIGVKTVAEFVHSSQVYEIVKSMGIDYAQGYFIGEPKPDLVQ